MAKRETYIDNLLGTKLQCVEESVSHFLHTLKTSGVNAVGSDCCLFQLLVQKVNLCPQCSKLLDHLTNVSGTSNANAKVTIYYFSFSPLLDFYIKSEII